MSKKNIPLVVSEKIFFSLDANRVSLDAKEELKNIIEEKAKEIAINSVALAKHSKRNTVLEEDVLFALKNNKNI